MTVKHPGRPADVGELASAHGQELVTLAYLLTGDRDEAQDVVQTVLTRLHGTDRLSRVEHPLAYARCCADFTRNVSQ